MGNSYVSGARPLGAKGIDFRRIASNSRARQKLSFGFMYLWDCELSAAQRKPAQLVDGLIPPKTVFRNDIIGLLPEFAGYGVLARFPFARGLPIARRSLGSATPNDTCREAAARRLSAANDCFAPQSKTYRSEILAPRSGHSLRPFRPRRMTMTFSQFDPASQNRVPWNFGAKIGPKLRSSTKPQAISEQSRSFSVIPRLRTPSAI
jgi:hypothetical protein